MEEVKQPLWYVIHTYSGYEVMVKDNIAKMVENNNLGDYITNIEVPMEDDIVESVADFLDEKFDIDADTVKELVELDVCKEVKGSEHASISYSETHAIKIGSKWYIVNLNTNENGDEVEYSVTFNVDSLARECANSSSNETDAYEY